MLPSYPIDVVIADDHLFFRTGFKKIIQDLYPGEVNFVAEVLNGNQLVEAVAAYHPQIVITDIQMPSMDGIEACRILMDQHPSLGVIAFTMFTDEEKIMQMIKAGAMGYLAKSSTHHEVIDAIRTVSRHEKYYCSSISDKVYGSPENSNSKKKNKLPTFGAQEIKIMHLICRQQSIKEIAIEMRLATRTVENYRQNILEKTGARNVVGIALYALIHEIVKFSEIVA